MTAPLTSDGQSLARLASLLADATRAEICLSLLDGRAWTAGELARLTGVSASTASEHLTRLIAGGLLTEERRGRHRYVRLASPAAARLVEDLAGQAAPAVSAPQSLRAVRIGTALARGRTCYDHLAGRLGVSLLEGLVKQDLVETARGVAVTEKGLTWLSAMGIDVAALRKARRPLARDCLDWTERRPHLAGAVGAALCQHFFDAGWIERIRGERAVRVTGAGFRAMDDLFDIHPADLDVVGP